MATAPADLQDASVDAGQLRQDGSLRHLLTLEGLSLARRSRGCSNRAQGFVRTLGKQRPATSQALRGVTVANLFTEPSTRTRVSFELAAKRLGADVVNLEVQLSSRVKGESMLDTVFTLEALHVDVLVIREAEAGVLGLVASNVAPHVSVLSAGEVACVASDAGAAGCAHRPAVQEALRQSQHRHRRRHPALARRALGVSGVHARSACRTCASSRRRRSCRRRKSSPAARATRLSRPA